MGTTNTKTGASTASEIALKSLRVVERVGTREQAEQARELAGVVAEWARGKGVTPRRQRARRGEAGN